VHHVRAAKWKRIRCSKIRAWKKLPISTKTPERKKALRRRVRSFRRFLEENSPANGRKLRIEGDGSLLLP
ncbi:unnamed protein product, partial [Musa acuminata subsp. burmannicoides]